MSMPPHDSKELEKIYSNRFDEHILYRNQVWKVLTSEFFSKLIPPDSTVLDLGCGYGEFINNIDCAKKLAMDMNPRSVQMLSAGVTVLQQDCSAVWPLPDESLDVVFTSNFFEHLPSKSSLAETLSQARRCLKKDGVIIAVGPDVRFVGGAYWDFWDHHLPLTAGAMAEAFCVQGFRIESSVSRFLPYTMHNRRRVPMWVVSLYLKVRLFWRVWGKQFLVIGRK